MGKEQRTKLKKRGKNGKIMKKRCPEAFHNLFLIKLGKYYANIPRLPVENTEGAHMRVYVAAPDSSGRARPRSYNNPKQPQRLRLPQTRTALTERTKTHWQLLTKRLGKSEKGKEGHKKTHEATECAVEQPERRLLLARAVPSQPIVPSLVGTWGQ